MSWHKHAKLLIAFSVIGPLSGCGSSDEGMPVPDLAGAGEDEALAATEAEEVSPNQPKGEYASPEQIEAAFAEARARAADDAAAGTDLKAPTQFYRYYDTDDIAWETITTNLQHICIMHGFGGKMGGIYGFMNVGLEEGNGNPIHVRRGQNSGVWETEFHVRCVPRTYFTTSNGFVPFQHRLIGAARQDNCGTATKSDYLFNGNWVGTIAGMGWSFDAGDEIWIDQTDSMSGTNKLKVKAYSGTDCWMSGYATGFAARNDGFPARFKGPNGTGTSAVAGEYTYVGPTSVYLGVSPEYLCYFSSIRGRGGPGPSALLYQTSPAGFYSLTVGAGTYARVRCVAFNQT